ncbi:MAG: hypothetical protein HYV08_00025 [Deltaproteobacteria bacterium]|nr:hypothetical protein [Deltaproteobacteria bacterium]MBI3076619.1 hypothetical protein [Deltaproteobacteria bacterium]
MVLTTEEVSRPTATDLTLTPRKGRAVTLRLAGSLLGLAAIATAGWLAWNGYAIPGLRTLDLDTPLSLTVFGFLAGVGAFFAPCAFALFPGYVSYYLTLEAGGPRGGHDASRPWRLGAAGALGALAFFVATGALLSVIAAPVGPYLVRAKPLVAVALVLLGIALIRDWSPTPAWLRGLRPFRGSGTSGSPWRQVFLYGFGYALASTGCTLPLYASIIIVPLTSGLVGSAFITFASFGLALSLVMLAVTVLVGLSREALVERLHASAVRIKRASGVVLILAGLYAGYYFAVAGM